MIEVKGSGWALIAVVLLLLFVSASFVGAIWGPLALCQMLFLMLLPSFLLSAIFRRPPVGYWGTLAFWSLPPVILATPMLSKAIDSRTEAVFNIIFWALVALTFLLLATFPEGHIGRARRFGRLRRVVAITLLWIGAYSALSIWMLSFIKARRFDAECRKLELRLNYDISRHNFIGFQQVDLVLPWEDDGDLKWATSGFLLPLNKQPAILEDLKHQGFSHWSGSVVGAWSKQPDPSHRYNLELVLRSKIENAEIHRTFLTRTSEYYGPAISDRCKSLDVTVLAPEHVILRHNLMGTFHPTLLSDGREGVALIGDKIIDEDLRIKHAAPMLQNPFLWSLAVLSWWQVPVWVLALASGLVGYLLGVALDIIKDEQIKPAARRVLVKVGLVRRKK